MGQVLEIISKIKELSPEQHKVLMNSLGVHRESEPGIFHEDLRIDSFEKWRGQLTHIEYILCVAYIQHGMNQAAAARVAGMSAPLANKHFQSNPHIQQFISQQVTKLTMTPAEMLFHAARIVRLSKGDAYDPETGDLDIKRAIRTGAIEKVKSIRMDEKGYQITFEENKGYIDILTKCAGLQKEIRYTGDIADAARQAGMSELDIRKHEELLEEKSDVLANQLFDLVRKGEEIDVLLGDDD
jgi:hypothetical protein